MEELILNTDIQNFINKNLNKDISTIVLKGSPFENISIQSIVEQIEAKKRCEHKLPTWFKTQQIYYPNKLNIEQTSSEATAKYKSKLIDGDSIIDLTGGFGVDCFYFSKRFSSVTHCEINKGLSEIAAHNFKQLQVTNISMVSENGIAHLMKSDKTYDWIYVDPSRRHDSKGKVFKLSDCEPNLPEHLEALFNHSGNILGKTSPLLDISIGLKELKYVKSVMVVALENDVKELLWILNKDHNGRTTIKCVNLTKDGVQNFEFALEDETKLTPDYGRPLQYLYEPNAAILKSGAFNMVAKQLNVFKLHKHSHLYTSNKLIEFPGRTFTIENILPYNKKLLKQESFEKANITTRNFPEAVQSIRKKFNIKDGGDIYLFFTTDNTNKKIVLICKKVV